jgi:hypothetical protein
MRKMIINFLFPDPDRLRKLFGRDFLFLQNKNDGLSYGAHSCEIDISHPSLDPLPSRERKTILKSFGSYVKVINHKTDCKPDLFRLE